MSVSGTCKLCGKNSILKESHIIPAFAFRWFKASQGHIFRCGLNPNKKIQDGVKYPMLCQECEQMLGSWENLFRQELFVPIQEKDDGPFFYDYRKWCLKFSVSVIWRVTEHLLTHGLGEYSDQQKQLINQAQEIWKEFLFDLRKNPGKNTVHCMVIDLDAGFPNRSEYFSRYVVGSVDTDIIVSESGETILIYAKIFKFVFFGTVVDSNSAVWNGTQLRVNRGELRSGVFSIPYAIMEFINARADSSFRHIDENLSDKQKQLTEIQVRSNMDRFRSTQIYKAGRHDIQMKD